MSFKLIPIGTKIDFLKFRFIAAACSAFFFVG